MSKASFEGLVLLLLAVGAHLTTCAAAGGGGSRIKLGQHRNHFVEENSLNSAVDDKSERFRFARSVKGQLVAVEQQQPETEQAAVEPIVGQKSVEAAPAFTVAQQAPVAVPVGESSSSASSSSSSSSSSSKRTKTVTTTTQVVEQPAPVLAQVRVSHVPIQQTTHYIVSSPQPAPPVQVIERLVQAPSVACVGGCLQSAALVVQQQQQPIRLASVIAAPASVDPEHSKEEHFHSETRHSSESSKGPGFSSSSSSSSSLRSQTSASKSANVVQHSLAPVPTVAVSAPLVTFAQPAHQSARIVAVDAAPHVVAGGVKSSSVVVDHHYNAPNVQYGYSIRESSSSNAAPTVESAKLVVGNKVVYLTKK